MKLISQVADLGEIVFSVFTLVLRSGLEEKLFNEILSRCVEKSSDVIVVVVDGLKITSCFQIVYSMYLSLRNKVSGMQIFRNANVEAISLMSCTTQIKEALDELSPLNKRVISVGVLSLADKSDVCSDVIRCILSHVDADDVICGVGCLRRCTLPRPCSKYGGSLDVQEAIICALLDRFR